MTPSVNSINQLALPASVNMRRVSTALPLAIASEVANASGQGLNPFLHGMKIIAAGIIRDMWAMSWPHRSIC